jgi:hypothetical protein
MSLVLHPKVTTVDFPALPDPFRVQAVRILVALRDDPHAVEASHALHASRVALDLEGCRAIRFGGVHYDDAYRVVFTVVGDDILVLAVGERQASEVFRAAQERLRPPEPRRRIRPAHNTGRVAGRR